MEWLELALREPMENLPVWIIIMFALVTLFGDVLKGFLGVFASNSKTIESENTLQARLIDEIAARRQSDDAHKKALLGHQEKYMVQIDVTTRDSNRRIRRIERGLTAIYREFQKLKEQGVLP